ncbi:hypothetical protein JYT25_00260 [bacterium AH-315-C20]|nr:hypothetical protein [bacterium AH-315-C20]
MKENEDKSSFDSTEGKDKVLRDLLQNNKEEITAADDFTDKVMAKIDAEASKKAKPIIGWPARIFLAAACITIGVFAFMGGDLPADNWISQLEIQESVSGSIETGINNSIEFMETYSLIGMLIVTILSFMFADRVLRFRKKVGFK